MAGKEWNGKTGVLAIVAVLITMGAAMAAIHARVVVPGILGEARKEAEEVYDLRMREHLRQPHIDAVTHNEMALLLSRLDSMDKHLDRIEAKIKD